MENNYLSLEQTNQFLHVLKERFYQNMHRHSSLEWALIEVKLLNNPDKLWSLHEMELTGGEVDVIEYHLEEDVYYFYDCSIESPIGRRSFCYDRLALDSRKANKPTDSVMDQVKRMKIKLLNEEEYQRLQHIEPFDLKTSSWIETPTEVRSLGGALFSDRRYGRVFVYHNGAESYYSVRGFRGLLKV